MVEMGTCAGSTFIVNESIAASGPWTCPYCGKENVSDAKACGEGEWDGCGAPKPKRKHSCDDPLPDALEVALRKPIPVGHRSFDFYARQMERAVEEGKRKIGISLAEAVRDALSESIR